MRLEFESSVPESQPSFNQTFGGLFRGTTPAQALKTKMDSIDELLRAGEERAPELVCSKSYET
jgi:hypothetical protein